jgi:hypothetical protein
MRVTATGCSLLLCPGERANGVRVGARPGAALQCADAMRAKAGAFSELFLSQAGRCPKCPELLSLTSGDELDGYSDTQFLKVRAAD